MTTIKLRLHTATPYARLGALTLAFVLMAVGAACDSKTDAGGSASEKTTAAPEAEPAATVEPAADAPPATDPSATADAPPAAALDACALVTADDVKAALDIADAVDASKDHLTLMGEFETACGYKQGDKLRVSFTVAPDAEGKDFGKLEAAKAAGLVSDEDDVAGKKAVRRTDGSLIWHGGDGRLYTINVFQADTAAPVEDKAPSRKLAELAIPRAAGG